MSTKQDIIKVTSRIALITIILAYCSVHAVDALCQVVQICQLDIPEDTPNATLHVFTRSGSTTGYTILNQNVTGRFSIAPNGTLSSATKLDYESNEKAYYLVFKPFDNTLTGSAPNRTQTWEIRVTDVNDEQPEFEKHSYAVNITSDVVNDTNVLNVSATDGDVSDAFTMIVYSIKVGGDRANFTINSDTGVIRAANNLTGYLTFNITVVATDSNNRTLTDEASVSVCINGYTGGSSSLEISSFAFMALVFGFVLM